MAEIISQIVHFIENLIQAVGYPGVFLALFAENIFPPIPTEGLLPISGMVAAQGKMTFVGVIAAAVTGAVLGSLVLYMIGAWADERLVRELVRRRGRLLGISEYQLDITLGKFRQYGAPILIVGRWLPVMRTVLSLAAGMSRMRLPSFIFLTALSSTLSTTFWVMLGYLLGDNWDIILSFVTQYESYILLVVVPIVMLVFVVVVRRLVLRRRQAKAVAQ